MLKTQELQQKNEGELTQLLETKRHDLWTFRFGASGSKVRNVKEGRTLRRDIARIITVINNLRRARS